MAKKAKPKGRKKIGWNLLYWAGPNNTNDDAVVCSGEVTTVNPALDVSPLLSVIEKAYRCEIEDFFEDLACPPDEMKTYEFVLIWRTPDGVFGVKKVKISAEQELKFELTDGGK